MRKIFVFLFVIWVVFASGGWDSSGDGLKVFISVDMEGIAGIVSGSECSPRSPDYGYFREIMTEETNAAIEGACVKMMNLGHTQFCR